MRDLTVLESAAVNGGATYWVPDTYVWECDIFGCYEIYIPGHYEQTSVAEDIFVGTILTLATVGLICAVVAA